MVVPAASSAHLDAAEIRCAGEQLYDCIADRLGEIPAGVPVDEAFIRTWLPLETWTRELIFPPATDARFVTGQWLDATNWLAEQTHLRRLLVPSREKVITAGQFGRTCPFETPERGTLSGRWWHLGRTPVPEAAHTMHPGSGPVATWCLFAGMPFAQNHLRWMRNLPIRVLLAQRLAHDSG